MHQKLYIVKKQAILLSLFVFCQTLNSNIQIVFSFDACPKEIYKGMDVDTSLISQKKAQKGRLIIYAGQYVFSDGDVILNKQHKTKNAEGDELEVFVTKDLDFEAKGNTLTAMGVDVKQALAKRSLAANSAEAETPVSQDAANVSPEKKAESGQDKENSQESKYAGKMYHFKKIVQETNSNAFVWDVREEWVLKPCIVSASTVVILEDPTKVYCYPPTTVMNLDEDLILPTFLIDTLSVATTDEDALIKQPGILGYLEKTFSLKSKNKKSVSELPSQTKISVPSENPAPAAKTQSGPAVAPAPAVATAPTPAPVPAPAPAQVS